MNLPPIRTRVPQGIPTLEQMPAAEEAFGVSPGAYTPIAGSYPPVCHVQVMQVPSPSGSQALEVSEEGDFGMEVCTHAGGARFNTPTTVPPRFRRERVDRATTPSDPSH